jgi:hypothetical protein
MKTTSKPTATPSVNPTVKPTVNPNSPTINPAAMPTTQPAVKPKSCIVVQTREKGGRILGPGCRYFTSSKKSQQTKEFSQKVAAKNPKEKLQKMDSGSTKTEIQGDESTRM